MTDSSLCISDPARDFAWRSLVPQLLASIGYCVPATADVEGTPWATPLFFAARGARELFWVSAPASWHSRNIAGRPMTGITAFDSTVPIVAAEALYLEAQAAVVNAAGHAEGLRVLNSKLPQSRALTHADLCPDGPVQLYRTTAERHFVLIGGGDSWFKNVLDCRQEVHESAFKSARPTGVG